VDALSEQIRAGILRPGDKLPTESAIMMEHGVSRTVVREALSGLQSAGFVETKHGIGTFVLELAIGLEFRYRDQQRSDSSRYPGHAGIAHQPGI
jgi:GntR family transcriptional regulator, transcriptional repressor for pyruvate dehydrogenase complex